MSDLGRWTHNICGSCWDRFNPTRTAARVGDAEPERCCWCGRQNRDGIYVRGDENDTAGHIPHNATETEIANLWGDP